MLVFLRFLALSAVVVALAGLVAAYAFFRWNYRYWSGRGVATTRPAFPFGDVAGVGFSKNMGLVFKDIYDRFEGEPVVGMWVAYRPYLMIRDPNLIRDVFIRDFNNFRDRGSYNNEKIDPLTGNLFFVNGVKWRNLRTKLTPAFSSNKMRKMMDVMARKGEKLREEMRRAAEAEEVIIPKDYAVGYTHEVFAECLLGVQEDSIRDRSSVLRSIGRKVFEPSWGTVIRAGFSFLLPQLASLLRVVATPRPVADFFLRIVREIMDFREGSAARASDFVEILSELRRRGRLDDADDRGLPRIASAESPLPPSSRDSDSCAFTFENAVAQAFIFWVGAFEASATTMQFALFEMSKNQEIQRRAREEVNRVLDRHDGRVTYDGLNEMEYLGRVVEETLRKYPPVAILNRVCTRDYAIPGTGVVVEEGVPILVSVLGLHMDPRYFPEPDKFDPERFTAERKSSRHKCTYLPFGDGPHACIGQRFALMQMKIALASLLRAYKFEMTDETPRRPVCCRKLVLYSVKSGIPLRVSRLGGT